MKNFLKKNYAKSLAQLNILNEYLTGDINYRKFIIISDSRTGSTLLMQLLNSHPNIIAKGELFKNLNGRTCEKIWKDFFKKRAKKVK